MGHKHRSWRAFLLGSNMYLFLAQCEQLYRFLAYDLKYILKHPLTHSPTQKKNEKRSEKKKQVREGSNPLIWRPTAVNSASTFIVNGTLLPLLRHYVNNRIILKSHKSPNH